MVLQVREETEAVKEPVEKEPEDEVVAVSPPLRLERVPQAKPRVVAFSPPVSEMVPFRMEPVVVREEAEEVVTEGDSAEEIVVKV